MTQAVPPTWSESGRYLIAAAFGYSPSMMAGDPNDVSGIVAMPVEAFNGSSDRYPPANMAVQTVVVNEETFAYTMVSTWTGQVFLAGDQVLAILDLLAHPPV